MTRELSRDESLRAAAVEGGAAERLIYADRLEERGDAELAELVRLRAEIGSLGDARLWTGATRTPDAFDAEAAPRFVASDFAPAARAMTLVAAVARSRPHDQAVREVGDWFPAAADALVERTLNWWAVRRFACARRRDELLQAGRSRAAGFVDRFQAELVWRVELGRGVEWTLEPLAFARCVAAARRLVPCRIDEVADATDFRFPVEPGADPRIEAAMDESDPEPPGELEELQPRWTAALDAFRRLARAGAVISNGRPNAALTHLVLLDWARFDEHFHAMQELSVAAISGDAIRRSMIAEADPEIQAAQRAWLEETRIEESARVSSASPRSWSSLVGEWYGPGLRRRRR